MGAGRTLLRKNKAAKKGSPKKGQPFAHVTTVRQPTPDWPHEATFHATKGRRCMRVAV